MFCPRCQSELFEAVKQGVVIDHCPECKGIWLDQGELAKIIAHMKQVEASLDAEFQPYQQRREARGPQHGDPRGRHYEDRRYDRHQDKHHYKKKSGFERLFEIFD